VTEFAALSDDELQDQLTIAQREAMEAKAEYEIRNSIIHNVMVMDPILKSVHGGERTGYAEKYVGHLLVQQLAQLTTSGASYH
jgi:hypothetical protein